MSENQSRFHLHMISDSTGETIIAVARAVSSQYVDTKTTEHIHPLIRNTRNLENALKDIEAYPGIVLYTIADPELAAALKQRCAELSLPSVNVLAPIFKTFQSYLGKPTQRVVGAQHALDAEYFKRIDALNFTMLHDDGAIPEDIESPDIILIGISRTSKTPTSIYLANRGIKTANIPLVPGMELPPSVFTAKKPLIVALIATTDRIQQVRQNRLVDLNAGQYSTDYADRATIAEELAAARKLVNKNNWSMIDVTRKSIEETAASIIALHRKHVAELKLISSKGE